MFKLMTFIFPGCASLMYLNGDKMAVSLSFGKKVITNRTLSSKCLFLLLFYFRSTFDFEMVNYSYNI